MSAEFKLNPKIEAQLRSSEMVKAMLSAIGEIVAGETREGIKRDTGAARMDRLAKHPGRKTWTPTGRLASSISYVVEERPEGWVCVIGSNAGKGGLPVIYAVTYLYGYDPSGPRAHYKWAGNDVLGRVLDGHHIPYRRRYS